jgi:transposase-like protein
VCVLVSPLSHRCGTVGEMAGERGLAISPSCVWRWVQTYGPELDKRCRRPLKPTNRSGSSRPAYPAAVDELKKDGTMGRRCQLRQCKYLNNVVAQDHRNVKCRTWLAKGYGRCGQRGGPCEALRRWA